MPTRFSYHELKASTKNFSCKLGEGGFGLVFEGILSNGMKVAVKRLEGFGQVKKSFLAEVETIGNIHHVNLVRLIGFCAEKSHRLLVYEYMCHGSLDKWIFHRNKDLTLGWQSRKKITLDIAKGLAISTKNAGRRYFTWTLSHKISSWINISEQKFLILDCHSSLTRIKAKL